jgi:hypothetical protein
MKKLSYNPILKGKSAPENRKQKYHIYLSRTRFHDKNWQKSGARFFLRSFESF